MLNDKLSKSIYYPTAIYWKYSSVYVIEPIFLIIVVNKWRYDTCLCNEWVLYDNHSYYNEATKGTVITLKNQIYGFLMLNLMRLFLHRFFCQTCSCLISFCLISFCLKMIPINSTLLFISVSCEYKLNVTSCYW